MIFKNIYTIIIYNNNLFIKIMEQEVNKNIGNLLRKLRKNKFITKSEMLRILNVSSQQLNKYENGTNRISASKLFVLLNELKISPNAFYNNTNTYDNDDMMKLIANYNKILNQNARKGILELVCTIAKSKI